MPARPSPASRGGALLPALLALAACGGHAEAPPPGMDRFNAALCPKAPAEDTSRPVDPDLEGAKAELAVAQRVVQPAANLRLVLTLKNIGLRNLSLVLPQQAFTLEGFELVDHACKPVTYVKPTTARALAYRNSGPMPLAVGESATIDSTLDGLAPGLELRRGSTPSASPCAWTRPSRRTGGGRSTATGRSSP